MLSEISIVNIKCILCNLELETPIFDKHQAVSYVVCSFYGCFFTVIAIVCILGFQLESNVSHALDLFWKSMCICVMSIQWHSSTIPERSSGASISCEFTTLYMTISCPWLPWGICWCWESFHFPIYLFLKSVCETCFLYSVSYLLSL